MILNCYPAALCAACSGSSGNGSPEGFNGNCIYRDARLLTKEGECDEEGREQGGHQGNDSDLGIDGRAGSILEGITYSIADDSCLVGIAALAALMTGFNIFLGVVPEAARIGHEQCQQQAGDDVAQQETANRLGAADDADYDGGKDAHQTGGNQLAQGAGGVDIGRQRR